MIVRMLVQPVVNVVSLVHTAAAAIFAAVGVEAAYLFSERPAVYTSDRWARCQKEIDGHVAPQFD